MRGLRHTAPALDLDITAVVTVGDDGGSSGRLRAERDSLPPGDLRQALAALADDDPFHQGTAELLQYRFAVSGHLDRGGDERSGAPASTHPGMGSGPGAKSAGPEPGGAGREPGAGGAGPERGAGGAGPERGAGGAGPERGAGGAGPERGAAKIPAGLGNAPSDRRITGVVDRRDPLAGHAVGNLLLVGLMELLGDPIAALEHVGRLVGARGRVLPMALHAVGIEADVRGVDPHKPDEMVTVRGQHAVAVTPGHVEAVRLMPPAPPACPSALAAVAEADWLIFGPGSWYTSVLPHLLVPQLAEAIMKSPARRLVTLNLAADIETLGLSAADHLAALHWYLPGLHVDAVLADARWVGEPEPVHHAAQALGARLVLAPVAVADGSPRHDPESLGVALVPVLGAAR
ncbi:2-phospho-L-lactate transferase CofD family protein [Krasilnikovia sp. MM14-A1004]|uniref:2-phospho-L-lactate transferase CofD family protein n=1 Tax=Krasilnikovia sp. MM14-A1004 TaxID=3373541 RepID=UPI00399CB7E8